MKNIKTFDLYKYGNKYAIQLEVCTYTNGNLAIAMTVWEDDVPEPWNILTVNLDGIREKNCAFIDTNNNGQDILKWIAEYNLGTPTGLIQQSGYCKYPEYRFSQEILEKIDAEGYAAYLSEHKQMKVNDH